MAEQQTNGISVEAIGQIRSTDISENRTPRIPIGAYDYGSGKIYTAFLQNEVVEGRTERVTKGMWSNNVGELTTFWTSSTQTNTQKQYYYEIFNGDPSLTTSEPQFSIAYGHKDGSGSLTGANQIYPSKAVYGQFQQILLPPNQRIFSFNNVAQNDIYVISLNSTRMRDRLDVGNWELVLSGSSGETLRLIDNSGDVNQTLTSIGESYNVVSGSLANGIESENIVYGAVYPKYGTIVLSATALDASASLGTDRTTNTDAQNHNRLFLAISGAAAANSDDGFQARSEEEIKSTFYYVNVKNNEYNFSNNPSFVTGSNGKMRQQTFIGDPKTFITTIGLFNNDNECLAVAKVSQPILKSFSNVATFKIRLDY